MGWDPIKDLTNAGHSKERRKSRQKKERVQSRNAAEKKFLYSDEPLTLPFAPGRSSARTQRLIAERLFNQSAPVTDALFNRAENVLAGSFDPTLTPGYQGLKASTEQQFQQARNRLFDTIPSGGALMDELTKLEGQRAAVLAQGVAGLQGQEMANAFTLGTGIAPQVFQGLGNAAQIEAQHEIAKNQGKAAESAKKGDTAQALGTIGGAIAGGPPGAAIASKIGREVGNEIGNSGTSFVGGNGGAWTLSNNPYGN